MMIPRVAKAGRSFKGAGLYYLHDKKAMTSERVVFTETVNLPTNDPQRSIAHMIDTAANHAALKKAAGRKLTRNLEKPVYSFSLAWHGTETPTKEEQIEAAKASLRYLKLDHCQALFVAHNDTNHPHIHVIANLVNPENGLRSEVRNDYTAFSRWALKYDRERGQNFCPEREKNNRARDQGEWRKHDGQSRQTHYEWKKQESDELWNEYRTERDSARESHKTLYDALWQKKKERLTKFKGEVKRLYQPLWRDMYKRQDAALEKFDSNFVTRLKFGMAQPDSNKFKSFLRAFTADHGQRSDFIRAQERERQALGKHQKQQIQKTGEAFTQAWKRDREQLRATHKAQDADRLKRYKDVSAQLWEKKNPDNAPDHAKGKAGEEISKATEKENPEQKPPLTPDQVLFGNAPPQKKQPEQQNENPDKPKRKLRSAKEILWEDRERPHERERER